MGQSLTKILRNYQKPNEKRSSYYVVSTAFVGFVSIFIAVYCFSNYPWLTFLLYPVIFITLSRSVVLLHDAGHNSLYQKKWKNAVAGNLMGLLNLIPKEMFSYMHNKHHASVGNLDKRDSNPELKTLTTQEYMRLSSFKKLLYRFLRSAFTRLILTPLGMFVVARIPFPILNSKGKWSVMVYNAVIGGVVVISIQYHLLFSLLVGYVIPLYACYILISIVFYLQHQFEETNWKDHKDWSLEEASLQGSSFLVLGNFMKRVTLNIGYHHIHHLNARIPGYNLADAHHSIVNQITFKEVRISEVFVHLRGKLWDDKSRRLIHFSEIGQ